MSGGGQSAGAAAAAECGFAAATARLPPRPTRARPQVPVWQVAKSRGKAFVDFQNDVTVSDVKLAAREGFRIPEHLKRYTTLGMATDQGKTGNLNGAAVLANVTGRYIGAVGTTTFRPPFTPVAISAFAGHHRGQDFRPARLAASHDWAEEQGAVFVETGPWLRALYYPRAGEEPQDAVNREVANVRNQVGVCDVSTLGKIDVQGRDAGTFLDRVYANTFSTLPVGKARYGLMLREDGFVLDDGTTARLAEDHYFMTTTTANAVKVMQHLEFCQQCLWPELDVQMVSVTEQWAQFAVAGPRARDVMQAVVDPAYDLSNEAFPYLACGDVTVCGGTKARLYRLSFSGELAYEIGVPARFGDSLVRAIMEAGAPFGIAPYGTEALGVLRIEKGHPAGGELNGQTTAHDLGMGKMLSAKKDFIGRFMAARPALTDPSRPTLVGLRPLDRDDRLRAGAHLLPKDAEPDRQERPGLCHLDRLLALARPLARAWAARPRAGAPWRDRARLRPGARRRRTGRGAAALLHRSGRGAPPCLIVRSVPSRRWPASPSPAAIGSPGGEPGVIIARTRGARSRDGRRPQRTAPTSEAAVRASYGVDLPDASALRAGTECELRRLWTGPMAGRVGDARQRGARPRSGAAAEGPCVDLRPERRPHRAPSERPARPRRSRQGPADRPSSARFCARQRRHQHDLADGRSTVAGGRCADLRYRPVPQGLGQLLALAHRLGGRIRLRGHNVVSAVLQPSRQSRV